MNDIHLWNNFSQIHFDKKKIKNFNMQLNNLGRIWNESIEIIEIFITIRNSRLDPINALTSIKNYEMQFSTKWEPMRAFTVSSYVYACLDIKTEGRHHPIISRCSTILRMKLQVSEKAFSIRILVFKNWFSFLWGTHFSM